MSNVDKKHPTKPGWWWRDDCNHPVGVALYRDALWWGTRLVTDDGHWKSEVLTYEEAGKLRADVERLKAALAEIIIGPKLGGTDPISGHTMRC